MARKKEINKAKILDIAYKIMVEEGIDSLTARNIAKAGHFSTQPIYLEFKGMDDLRRQVLERVSDNLQTEILKQNFTGKALFDLDLSYISFARKHVDLFCSMFITGKYGEHLLKSTLIDLATQMFKKQYGNAYTDEQVHDVIIANWIVTNGIATLEVNGLNQMSGEEIVECIKATIERKLNQYK